MAWKQSKNNIDSLNYSFLSFTTRNIIYKYTLNKQKIHFITELCWKTCFSVFVLVEKAKMTRLFFKPSPR